MTPIDDYRSRILTILGDSTGSRYSQTQVDEALRSALDEYSTACPANARASFTVVIPGKRQTISGLSHFQFFIEVQWPADPDPEVNRVKTWRSGFVDGVPQIQFSQERPQAGDVINLVFAAGHTIDGLDEAAVTTVPPVHESLLALGAAAHAAVARSTQISEQLTSRVSNATQLLTWGNDRLAEFRTILTTLALVKTNQASPGGWTLDYWDRQLPDGMVADF